MNLKLVRWVDVYIGIPLAYLMRLKAGLNKAPSGASEYKKILLVKFWGIGNVVMLLPTAAALKRMYPGAEVDFFTLSGNKEVARLSGLFNNIYALDISRISRFISSCFKNIPALRRKDYDLIVDFEQFARFSALCCAFIGKRDTAGFHTRNQCRHFLYRRNAEYNNTVHITRSFYSLAELLGAERCQRIGPVPLRIADGDISQVRAILSESGIYQGDLLVVLHIGTSENFILRRWPVAYFATLADRLVKDLGAKIVFTGLASEGGLAQGAIMRKQRKDAAVNLSGRVNLGQFVALVSLADLVVSADTAAVHLASALSVPVAGLYGPNTPLLYGPWGKEGIYFYHKQACSPCITNYNAKINRCRHPEAKGACMKRISAEEVFSGIKEAFFKNHAKVPALSSKHSAQ
jgi:ADP-heptose:LPS heptosyltransferase